MALSREDRAALLQELSALKSELASLQGGGQPDQPEPSTYPMQQPMSMDPNAQPPKTSLSEAIARGGAQGFLMGWEPQVAGVTGAMNPPAGTVAPFASNPSLPPGVMLSGLSQKPKEKMLADYRDTRDSEIKANEKAQKDRPTGYGAAQVGGAILSSVIPVANVAKAAKGTEALGRMIGGGMLSGAVTGLGESKADLTKGEWEQGSRDMLRGGIAGGLTGVAAGVAAPVVAKGGEKLLEAGRSRLFKAVVGPNKPAFKQIDGKNLLKDAAEYVDKDLRIGFGDSTKSIGEKLSKKADELRGQLDGMVSTLDTLSGGKPVVSASKIAQKIENDVAAPLKRAGAIEEYEQVRKIAREIRKQKGGLSFTDAAKRRGMMQKKANYDVRNRVPVMDEVRQDIARIYNEVIDDAAEPLLKGTGKAGDAYKELRLEDRLVLEMLKHNESQVASEKAASWARPSKLMPGGVLVGGAAIGHPVLGLLGAGASYLAKVYGNSAAGRSAIALAKALEKSAPAISRAAPTTARASGQGAGRLATSSEDDEDNQGGY